LAVSGDYSWDKNGKITIDKINVGGLSTYTGNSAAKTGGLVDGDLYRNSIGSIMVVYT
jgi:hypothetical protein